MEKLTPESLEGKIESESEISIDPETSEILEKFLVDSKFGVECWQGVHSFNLFVPKSIFKKIGPSDPRLEIFSKTLGAKEDGDFYIIKLPTNMAKEKVQETNQEITERIQKIVDEIEKVHEANLGK
ncbi:MAG: hypothetical protein WC415_05050 [Patescibacteria group bacterium]|jgi:hypothetical protein